MTLLVEHVYITGNNEPNPNPNREKKNIRNPNPNPNLSNLSQDTRKVQNIVFLSPKIDKFSI